jgi:isocitrate/isopropylmalate dehydrogenase
MTIHTPVEQLIANAKPQPGAAEITVAFGDGIGPEIMSASLKVLLAAGAKLAIEPIDIGERVYLAGNSAGIAPESWDSLRRTKVFYKAPITTPQGGGFKSLNVTVRKTLGLYANVRPCSAYAPFIATKHPDLNVVIVRENEEEPLCRHRAPANRRSVSVLEDHLAPRLREDCAVRIRVCASAWPQEGDVLHQRQHYEAHRRPVS